MSTLTPQQRLMILRDLETSLSLGFNRGLSFFEEKMNEKEKEFEKRIVEMKAEIQKLQLKDGYTPRKFIDYFTPAEIDQIIKASTPQKGKDYLTPKEIDDTNNLIAEKIGIMIEAKNSTLPKLGIDYPTFEQVRQMVSDRFYELESVEDVQEVGDDLIDGIKEKFTSVEMSGETILQKINSLPFEPKYQIPASRIIGLPRGKNGKYLHGGGDVVTAGVGISISSNTSTGVKTISSSVTGEDSATETLVGTQSGNNVTLDLTQLAHTFVTILFVSRQGQILNSSITDGWSRSANTITITNAAAFDTFQVTYTYT